eukprot:TRINITY_DN34953_c0_g1_i1.p2 TRINITY_DN34953_c0_g1~~TRINITY_DN34953_c0_g1_i1.p2  ORF type:complete len:145 (+),score=20.46 TRINITY_DN34953_c0_g1_i1:490-924(+)
MVCLDALGQETWIRGVPVRTHCGHLFHSACLRKTLRVDGKMRSVCPNCRAEAPLQGAHHFAGDVSLDFNIQEDVLETPLNTGSCYRIVAVLCQDPQAVIDSAIALSCVTLSPGDPPPTQASFRSGLSQMAEFEAAKADPTRIVV